MEKIKRLVCMALLTAVVCIAAACGRNDDYGHDSGNAGTAGTQMTEATSEGIVNDMMDDVEQGIDHLTDAVK